MTAGGAMYDFADNAVPLPLDLEETIDQASGDLQKKDEFRSPIKWPGGKSKEFSYIEHLIPQHYDRYFEPFLGGGAVFFKLQPQRAVINDFSPDLMDFYKFLKDENDKQAFSEEIYDYVDNWEKVAHYVRSFEDNIIDIYYECAEDKLDDTEVYAAIERLVQDANSHFNGLFSQKFCIDRQNFSRQITRNLASKLKRTSVIERQRGGLPKRDLEKNIETAFRSGFYMHFRDLMNGRIGDGKISAAKRTANFYFVREFCYGSMFRFNAAGEFNIPYGGMAYNTKDFRKKVDYMLSDKFRDLFKNTAMENGDFEAALDKHSPSQDDFIFLDPPYDSDFSDYDNQAFGNEDHVRLADYLRSTPAKWILLIKETPFINSLYQDKSGIKIEKFQKTYLYNVKGRNDQQATHLIIYNY